MKNKIIRIIYIVTITLIILIAGIAGFVYFGLRGISESHINANVPDESVFDEYLLRDLDYYFSEAEEKSIEIEYELLRDYPTQTGTAFPKYYIWVIVKDESSGEIIENGLARVASVRKESFQVFDYFSETDIKNNIDSVYKVFPQDVINKAESKITLD